MRFCALKHGGNRHGEAQTQPSEKAAVNWSASPGARQPPWPVSTNHLWCDSAGEVDTRSATPVGWEPPGGREGRGGAARPRCLRGNIPGITERVKSKLAAAISISHLSQSPSRDSPPNPGHPTATPSFRSRSLTEHAPPALSAGCIAAGQEGGAAKVSDPGEYQSPAGDETKTLRTFLKTSTLTRPGCPLMDASSHFHHFWKRGWFALRQTGN